METKPFVRTSEFWLTMATNAIAMASYLGGVLPPKYGVPLQVGANAAYTISRGLAKSGVLPPRRSP